MKFQIYLFNIALLLTFISCKQHKKEVTIKPGWTKRTLPNNWIFYAPAGFTCEARQGIDSEPGYIISKKDNIVLQYDSGYGRLKSNECSIEKDYQKAKRDIDSGFYHTYYKHNSHDIYIDTIDENIAVIAQPLKAGKGHLDFWISDCPSGDWLGINGSNLPTEKQRLVLEIFKTIKHVEKE